MECRWGTMKVAIVVSDKKKYPIQYQKPTNRNSPKKIKKMVARLEWFQKTSIYNSTYIFG